MLKQKKTNNKFFKIWKKGFSKVNKIYKIKKLFDISRNGHDVAKGYDIKFLSNKQKIDRYLIVIGNSVQIVPLIYCKTNKTMYTILVEQTRIGSEKKICEFPCGFKSEDDKNLKEAAKREIREELNIEVKNNEIHKLSKVPITIQPVNSFSRCYFFYFNLTLDIQSLKKMNNKITGMAKENEFCKIKVYKLKDLEKMMLDSTIIGLKLLEKKLKKNISEL